MDSLFDSIKRPVSEVIYRAANMHITSDEKIALGLDLGGSSVKWGLVTTRGEVLHHESRPIIDRSPEKVASVLRDVVGEGIEQGGGRVTGIGIGSPGLIDITRTVVRLSPNFPLWHDVELAGMVGPATNGLPLVIENDANLLVYSETRWGAAKGLRDVIVLTLGTGVGGGVMVDGELLRGTYGGAGELGHIPLDFNGPVCGCGSRGCLEVFCNIDGTLRAAEETYAPEDPPADPQALSEAAQDGDVRALETWRRVGFHLGVGVAALVNIFNPSIILIGGGISAAGEFLLKPARKVAAQRSYAPNWEQVKFRLAELGAQSGMIGAAALAFEQAGVEVSGPG